MNRIIALALFILMLNQSFAQTILFSEDFEDEVITDMTGNSSQGIAWTATCPNCVAGDIFEVNTFGAVLQGLRGNDTNGPATFTASGIDATGMHILILEFDYESSGYSGSGNLECHTECSGCSGDPADALVGSCNNCWDYLAWEISTGTFTDGGIVLGNDCSVPDADHIISDPSCSSPYDANGNLIPGNDPSNLTVTIEMAMWASAENMIIDNVVITGYTKSEAIAAGLMSEAGDDNTVDLCNGPGTHNLFSDLLGTPDNGGVWDGPASTSNGDLGTIDLSSLTTGDYLYITSTGAGCQDTAIVTVTNNGTIPTSSVSGVQDICQGDNVTVTGNGNGSFEWSDGSTNSTLNINSAGNYWLAVFAGCTSDTTFFTIGDLGSAPTASVSGVQDICSGNTITVTGSGSGTFEWSDMSTGTTLDISSAGNYYLAVENICGQDTAFFTVNDLGNPPTASVTGVQDICTGESVIVTANGTGSYTWSDNSTGSTLSVSTPGNYFLTVTNACGSDTENFTVGDLGSAPAGSLAGNQFVCDPNASTTLIASGGTSYFWSTSSTSTAETFSAGENGYVLIMNQCGQDSIAFAITNETVIAAFSLSDSTGEEPVTIQTINNSVNADSYDWSLGDGGASTDYSPVIEYPTSGDYIITLIATNTFGCSDTATATVYVIDPTPLVIPNIFTPNNDDVNDLFKVVHYSVEEFTGSIYNRWGQKLFENSDQYIFQWDGYNESGKPAPGGTYFYILEATFANGEKQTFSGSLELIR